MSNALFSGIALAALVITLFLQSVELRYQREELGYQRREMGEQAFAQLSSARLSAMQGLLDYYLKREGTHSMAGQSDSTAARINELLLQIEFRERFQLAQLIRDLMSNAHDRKQFEEKLPELIAGFDSHCIRAVIDANPMKSRPAAKRHLVRGAEAATQLEQADRRAALHAEADKLFKINGAPEFGKVKMHLEAILELIRPHEPSPLLML